MLKSTWFLFFLLISGASTLISFFPSPYFKPSTEKELGEILFFDPILSLDSTISCATCHKPAFAFADSQAISPGVHGAMGRRNAPSVMNIAFRDAFFYDGRAVSLEDQVHFPIEDPMEMNLKMDDLVERLRRKETYQSWFIEIYGEAPNQKNIAKAIAAFESSLETDDSAFDQYMNGDRSRLSESAKRGRQLFLSDRAKCFDCHFGPDFTGDEFKNIGLYDEIKYKDKGRFEVTKNKEDLGRFKVPGLRNVAVTGPYMHDGSFTSLRQVIDYYDNPFLFVENPINMDTLLRKPLGLTEQEKQDLEAFLVALTDSRFAREKKQ